METVGSSGPNNAPRWAASPGTSTVSRTRTTVGFGKILTTSDLTDDTGRPYAVAWALVHFLVNQRPQELGALQARFVRGQDPAAAWREVFPAWDPASADGPAALDRELGGYRAAASTATAM